MYGNPYMNGYSPIQSIDKQIEDLQNMKARYAQQPQVTNVINPSQPQIPSNSIVEWRVLNENEQVDNLYVERKTLFVGDNMMVLKDVNGKLEKWNIKKTYPVDPKDQKIEELERQIQELKGMIGNEPSKFNKPVENVIEPNGNDDVNVEPSTKANSDRVQQKK